MTPYLTPADASGFIGTKSDGETIAYVVEAVSRLIDAYTGEFFGQTGTTEDPEERVFPVVDGAVTFPPFSSLVELVASTPAAEVVEPGWRPEPIPYRQLTVETNPDTVTVEGVWGWPAIPEPVKMACRLQSAHVFKRQDSPLGVAGFGEFGVVRVPSRLDPDVARMLDPYRRGDWMGFA